MTLGRFVICAVLIAAFLVVPGTTAGYVTIGASHTNPTPTASSETSFITIDPIGNHTVGDVFFVNGTTNLWTWEKSLDLNIGWFAFNPAGFGSSFYITNASIQPGENGTGTWSAEIIPSQWEIYTTSHPYPRITRFQAVYPGEYAAYVSSSSPLGPTVVAQQTFVIISPENNVTMVPPSTTADGAQSSSSAGTVETGSGNTVLKMCQLTGGLQMKHSRGQGSKLIVPFERIICIFFRMVCAVW